MGINEGGTPCIIDMGGRNNDNGWMSALFGLLGQNGGFGGGGWMIFLLVLVVMVVLVIGWRGNNNNNSEAATIAATLANGAMTRNEVTNGFNAQEVNNGIRGIQNGLCDGFYAQNTTMLQGFNGTQRDIMQTGYQLSSAIAENRFAAQQCCCETNRNIDSVKFENAQNTCQITMNATANTQKILDRLNQMESNAKDQQITQLQFDLQAAQLQIGNIRQKDDIVNAVRPFPSPAYITCSPYTSVNGFGCGNSCGGC